MESRNPLTVSEKIGRWTLASLSLLYGRCYIPELKAIKRKTRVEPGPWGFYCPGILPSR